MLSEMGKYWSRFREQASRKEERGHFGLAWSVFAGYFLAAGVFMRSFHESGWLMTFFNVLAIVFFVLGGIGVYMAFAVAMRWWPHHPKKWNFEVFMIIQTQYFAGITLLQEWAKLEIEAKKPQQPDSKSPEEIADMAAERAQLLVNWETESKDLIVAQLGDDLGLQYHMAPNSYMVEPAWALDSRYVGLWNVIQGRIDWMRAWLNQQLVL